MRNTVVLGSGTSGAMPLVTALVRAGATPGPTPDVRRARRTEAFDAPEVAGINELLIGLALPASRRLRPWQHWLTRLDPETALECPEWVSARMTRLTERAPWVLHDPRFVDTLPAWEAHVGDALLVCCFQGPARASMAMLDECRTQPYLRDLQLDFDRAVELWRGAYERVLAHAESGRDCVFVHAGSLADPAARARFEERLGTAIAFEPEPDDRTACDVPAVPGEVAELYDRLCELAEFQPDERPPVQAAPTSPESPRGRIDLSVVVDARASKDRLEELFDEWKAQTLGAERLELIVVGDGSDRIEQAVERSGPVLRTKVVACGDGPRTHAYDAALESAEGRWLLFADGRFAPEPGLAAAHLALQREAASCNFAVVGRALPAPGDALAAVLERRRVEEIRSEPWRAFDGRNVSVAAGVLRAVGGFACDYGHDDLADLDLALRLEERGCVLRFLDEGATRTEPLDLDRVIEDEGARGADWARLCARRPALVRSSAWAWALDVGLPACEDFVRRRMPHVASWLSASRELSRIDLHELVVLGDDSTDLGRSIADALSPLLREVLAVRAHEGLARGLAATGLERLSSLESLEPFPLGTDASLRYLAWPDYGSEVDLDALFDTWGRRLESRGDACLVLVHDPATDGAVDHAKALVEASAERHLGDGCGLQIVFLSDRILETDLPRLGRSVHAALLLPGSEPARRRRFLERLRVPLVTAPAEEPAHLAF